jgi:Tol biopolymer transport system component
MLRATHLTALILAVFVYAASTGRTAPGVRVKEATSRTRESRPAPAAAGGAGLERMTAAYGRLPMSFEANQGQADAGVKFLARGHGYDLLLTPAEAVLSLSRPAAEREGGRAARQGARRDVLRMKLLGTNPSPDVSGLEELPGKSNYFIGDDPARWRTGVSHYSRVKYASVYSGVDMVYYGNQRQLEYDFVVAPGADSSAIRLAFEGARGVEIDAGGDLVLRTPGGEVRQRKPFVYQEAGGERREIAGRYVMKGKGQIGFDIGAYDPTLPLVIDPVLVYSTYLGNDNDDYGMSIAVDAAGNAYVTGVGGPAFPTTAGAYNTLPNGQGDVFVAKLNAAGSALVYSTYIGGTGADHGYSIAVDGAGNAYVTGFTTGSNLSGSYSFPTTAGAFDTSYSGNTDAFVLKLNPTGSGLVYSTFLGGSGGGETGYAVAIDVAGNAYVGGTTTPPSGTTTNNFPTVPGSFDTTFNGWTDGFVTKVNAAGSALLYSTYLGGSASGDWVRGLAVDGAGNAYVTGFTGSTNFPKTAGAFDTTYSKTEAFVTKLNANGSALVYSTYLGGSIGEETYSVAVDEAGSAYVTGYTTSTDFPVTPDAFDTTSDGHEAFVTKLNATGSALAYSTFLGGTGGSDWGSGIALGTAGEAYVTGSTTSPIFPTTADAFDASHNGLSDGFVTKLNAAGSALLYSTYLGGSAEDAGFAIAVDAAGDMYVAGRTTSSNFQTTPGAADTSYNGNYDVFIARIDDSTPTPSPTPTPALCVNVASASNGGAATASSTTPDSEFPGLTFDVSSVVNGDRRGLNWEHDGGWRDGNRNLFPDWVQVDFAGEKTVSEVNVFSLQDNYASPSEPTEAMTFTLYGLTSFEAQYWDGAQWVTPPGASVTGNNKVWRKFVFPAVTTSKVRVLVHATKDGVSRITEVEAFTPCGAPTPTPTPTPCPPIVINPQAAPAATVGTPYELTFAPAGGGAPYTFDVSGNFPPGLSLSAGGQLAGTPNTIGTFNFNVTATDANGCSGSRAYELVVSCPVITLAPSSLPNGTAGAAYDQTITPAGGSAPYTFTASGGLPPGLGLDAAGRLAGTPSASGTFNFNVTTTDGFGCSGAATYALTINPAPTPTPTPAPTPESCNVALAAHGATATASSQFGFPGHPSGFYPAGGVIDGEHDGNNWGAGGAWNDATNEVYPDVVEVNFNATRTIQEIHVYTLKNQPNDGSVVGDSTPADVYGIRNFRVEYYDGSSFQNVLGGVIAANTYAKRRFVFPPVTTDRIRVVVDDSADHLFSRVVEIEAFTCNPGCPAPPPAGKIAFESYRDGNSEIYVTDADGRNPVRLTNNGARDADPFFSPDGTRIVFPSDRDGNYEIYVMNVDGTNLTRLTSNSVHDHRPAFSPDGSKIAFSRNSGSAGEIYVMNADGTNQVRLTNNSASDQSPKWSPDGTKLVFHSERDGDSEIYVMNADGSNVVKLTNNNSYDNEASFSPDGTRIVFASDRSGNTEVWVMNADGSQPVNLTNSSNTDGSCSWTADGRQILFVSGRDGNTEVYVMNADGTEQRRLTVNNVLENTPVSQPVD